MELREIILFVFLIVASIWDLKEKRIPVWVFSLTAVLIVCLDFGYLITELLNHVDSVESTRIVAEGIAGTESRILAEKLAGMAVGLVLLAVSKLTGGEIGEGDGIAFLITGFTLGFRDNFLLLCEALLLSFVWSLIFIIAKKINLKTSLPFVPFVLIAFAIHILPVMSF